MRAAGTCLSCFGQVAPNVLSKCVVHSCCSRPVCPQCLLSMPRLATFCPFCEDVRHAFRKGPRSDVIRAGQVVFDLDRTLTETPDEGEGNADAPPSYCVEDARVRHAFVLEQDNGAVSPEAAAPRLLQMSRLGHKQVPAELHIDRSLPVTISPSSSTTTLPSKDSLQQSLTRRKGESPLNKKVPPHDERLSPRKHRGDDHSDAPSSSGHSLRPVQDADDVSKCGLTRQYWLRPDDTLMSLCLRFRVNSMALCKLNDLPQSTAISTPHLIHTRQFLLIPEDAIHNALSQSSIDAESLLSALNGPLAQTRRTKKEKARKEAQSKFRAIIARNEQVGKGKAIVRSDAGDLTLCDKAAKAYISLMEAELKCIDFGDGVGEAADSQEGEDGDYKEDEVEEVDAAIEAGRKERYNMIVKQAVCRWEMDSDWEREQRAMGITPVEGSAPFSSVTAHSSKSKSSSVGWLKRLTPSFTIEASPNRSHWPEKAL